MKTCLILYCTSRNQVLNPMYHFTSAPKRKVAQLFLILLALANYGYFYPKQVEVMFDTNRR